MWNVSPHSGRLRLNILGPSDHNVDNWVAKGYGYGSRQVRLAGVNEPLQRLMRLATECSLTGNRSR